MRVLRTAAIAAAAGGLLIALTLLGVVGHARPTALPLAEPSGPAATVSPRPELPRPGPPILLEPVGAATTWPTAEGIAEAIALYFDDLGPRVGVAVYGDGRELYGRNANAAFIPASTTKLLTAAAALKTLDPAATFQTSVVRGSADNAIVLVGGGDPLLAAEAPAHRYPERASLADLADQTIEDLPAGTPIALDYDTSLFSGPTTAPGWRPTYLSPGTAAIAPVSPLVVDGARVGQKEDRVRETDPAAAAAQRFAKLLADRGVTVSIGGPVRATTGAPLATVSSPPVSALVEVMLSDSDNDVAEALARHIALARGEPATFAGATEAIAETIIDLGLDPRAFRLYDGSGLSRNNAITPRALAELLTIAARQPQLRGVLSGLPVAGFTGTLDDRPDSASGARSAGLVRAKTGTLLGVNALAGVAYDRGGRLLVFAVMADRVPAPGRAVDGLDAIANALATCGCG